MNISSIIVRTKKEHLDEVIQKLNEVDFCEYHLDDRKGNIVVTIEGNDIDEEVSRLKLISSIPKVISAEMAYSYSENELSGLREKMENNIEIPDWLNKDKVDARDINYSGRIDNKK